MRLYYLGPKGTFSYLASQKFILENDINYSAKSNLHEVIKAVSCDNNSIGIVPIENSIEGTINIVADALAEQKIYAHGEIHLDIDFALYGYHSDRLQDIKKCIQLHLLSVKQPIIYSNIIFNMIILIAQFKV